MIWTAAWFLAGLAGAALLHWNWKWNFHETVCPSPAEILKCLMGSFLGLMILAASIIIWMIDLLSRPMKRWKWLHTPICKPKS